MTSPMNPLQTDLRAETDYRRLRLADDFRRAGGRSHHRVGRWLRLGVVRHR